MQTFVVYTVQTDPKTGMDELTRYKVFSSQSDAISCAKFLRLIGTPGTVTVERTETIYRI